MSERDHEYDPDPEEESVDDDEDTRAEEPTEPWAPERERFGLSCVESVDSWIDYAVDRVESPEPRTPSPRPWDDSIHKDRDYQEAFRALSKFQRTMVLRLVREVAGGTMFTLLSRIDRLPDAESAEGSDNARDKTADGNGVPLDEAALEELFFAWMRRFSRYAEALDGD